MLHIIFVALNHLANNQKITIDYSREDLTSPPRFKKLLQNTKGHLIWYSDLLNLLSKYLGAKDPEVHSMAKNLIKNRTTNLSPLLSKNEIDWLSKKSPYIFYDVHIQTTTHSYIRKLKKEYNEIQDNL